MTYRQRLERIQQRAASMIFSSAHDAVTCRNAWRLMGECERKLGRMDYGWPPHEPVRHFIIQ